MVYAEHACQSCLYNRGDGNQSIKVNIPIQERAVVRFRQIILNDELKGNESSSVNSSDKRSATDSSASSTIEAKFELV